MASAKKPAAPQTTGASNGDVLNARLEQRYTKKGASGVEICLVSITMEYVVIQALVSNIHNIPLKPESKSTLGMPRIIYPCINYLLLHLYLI